MKIAIIDKLGLCYDGDTLKKQGLGGSESSVIYISRELARIGFDVTVFNNCIDASHSKPGVYDGVNYVDNSQVAVATNLGLLGDQFDIVIVSRTLLPFTTNDYPFIHRAKKRILWLHDTFIEGEQMMEQLVMQGKINYIFTLSDWHTTYILNSTHGPKRNFEVLKKKVFQTRNGAVCHIPEVDLSKKDQNHFVHNSSATKGMIPLLEDIWPEIKKRLPDARLTVIGGYYRFREGAAPDVQESTVEKLSKSQELKDLGVTFTGVIPQQEIAKILANAWMMLYPGAFPETFGISTLESLLYKTPLVTTRFGALEETAVEQACYLIDHAIEPNSLFPHIDKKTQVRKFLNKFFEAYSTPYLHQQKQNYCDVVKDVAGWDTVALQWKQFFYSIMGEFLSIDEYRGVTRINDKVSRIFGRTSIMPVRKEFKSYGKQRKIVIISPFWNSRDYIERNILSIAQQEYDNYVHVLIDDASTDDSFQIARDTIDSLPKDIQKRFRLIRNESNVGAIANQIAGVSHCKTGDVVMLLDGDDWLINNNTIFHYYNDLYSKGYEFTYGSTWSVVDNIPLISQEYPRKVRENRSYRNHHFNWKIPYTHLRTCLSDHFFKLDTSRFKADGEWMKSGADNPLFYELIERVDPDKIYCNREIVCMYNDANPLNDYKVRGDEQNKNANRSYTKKFSVVVPTMWRANDLFKRSLESLIEHRLVDEVLVINNQVDKTPDWSILQHAKISLLNQVENIKVNPSWNLGVKTSRNNSIAIINDDLFFDTRLFDRVRDHMKDEKDLYCFTVGGKKYNQPEITDGNIDMIEWKPGVSSYGYGQLIIVNKKYWRPIVGGLDFYFGDDFIFKSTIDRKGRVFLILNMKYEADFGSTTRELGIDQEYYDREKLIYNNWIESIDNEKSETMKRILIAIPTNKYIEPETFKSIYDLDIPEGYEVDFQFFYGYQIDQIRNLIAEWAKRYDYLFSVDSDIVLPPDSLRKMIYADKDIVTGLYIQRIPGTHTIEVYMVNPAGGLSNIPQELLFQHNGLVEVAGCGFGCCLVKGEVFRKMEYPHFYYQSALDHKNTVSEDVYFCKKARDLGFRVWADTTIICDHKGATFFKVEASPKKEMILLSDIIEERDNGITVIPDKYRKEKVFR